MIWPFAPPSIVMRPLGPGDARDVAQIHAEGFAQGWRVADLERMLTDAAIIGDGATMSGWPSQLAGFALSRIAADEAEILSIGVRRARQGRGVAARLLGRHLSRVAQRGVREMFLEVEEGNAPAIALYRRFGFAEVGRRPSYYRKQDGSAANAIVMRRPLD